MGAELRQLLGLPARAGSKGKLHQSAIKLKIGPPDFSPTIQSSSKTQLQNGIILNEGVRAGVNQTLPLQITISKNSLRSPLRITNPKKSLRSLGANSAAGSGTTISPKQKLNKESRSVLQRKVYGEEEDDDYNCE